MKFRGTDQKGQTIQLQMTPMIDIVFQLLIFFILTFKVTVYEGDFSIRMPLATDAPPSEIEDPIKNILVRLIASNGLLASIDVDAGKEVFSGVNMYNDLHSYVRQEVESNTGPDAQEIEVEFDIDRNLQYGHTVSAIEAVTGYVQDGRIHTLIDKVKFKDNSENEDDPDDLSFDLRNGGKQRLLAKVRSYLN